MANKVRPETPMQLAARKERELIVKWMRRYIEPTVSYRSVMAPWALTHMVDAVERGEHLDDQG